MKKVLITGYFVLMFTLTYVVALAVSTYKSEKVEFKTRVVKKGISETEAHNIGVRVDPPNPDAKIIRIITLNEYRTKKLFGWDLKIDTVSVNYAGE